jgi:hypothetical protein
VVALVAILLTTFVMAALGRATPSSADRRSTMSSTARLVWHWQRGAAVRAWSPGEFSSFESDAALRALKRTGTTTAVFIAPWYMARPASTTLGRGPETPTDGSLRHAIAEAKALGLAVVIKPHVEVLDGTFRGAIAPASVSAWFSAYRDFLQHYADLARTSRARPSARTVAAQTCRSKCITSTATRPTTDSATWSRCAGIATDRRRCTADRQDACQAAGLWVDLYAAVSYVIA